MDSTQIYAAVIGGVISLLLVTSMIRQIQQRISFLAQVGGYFSNLLRRPTFFFLKHVVYPFALGRTRFFGPFSRYTLITQIIYWVGTVFCNIFRVTSASVAGTRAGELAVINFVLLLMGGRFELLSDFLGIQANGYRHMHQTVSIMTFLQSSVHILLNIWQGISVDNSLQLFGILAAAGMACLLLTAVIKRLWYELFTKLHFLLGIFVLITLWRHLQIKKAFGQLYLLIGSIILLGSTFIQWFLLTVRNVSASQIGCRADILRTQDQSAVQIIISPTRPFKVQAGMTVYIWMPGFGIYSIFQSHPFTIAWWENDNEGKAKTISLLIKPKSGFTKRLMTHKFYRFTSFIEGPYGKQIDFTSYDRVLMIATGMGIAAQVSYLKELVETNDKKRATRKLYVVWQVDDESNLNWIHQWMDRLLLLDQGTYMLKFGIYVPPANNNSMPTAWDSEHDRIWKIPAPMNPAGIVGDWWADDGKALITVSANDEIRDGIKKVAKNRMTHVVDIVDLPFQP